MKIEDDLKFFENGRRPQFFEKGRRPQTNNTTKKQLKSKPIIKQWLWHRSG
jgi:hypothetical protein